MGQTAGADVRAMDFVMMIEKDASLRPSERLGSGRVRTWCSTGLNRGAISDTSFIANFSRSGVIRRHAPAYRYP